MDTPLVSVVVVAREGFDKAPACLERLLEATTTPFRLIYVDGKAPARIARAIRRLVSRRGGVLIRADRYLRPTYARTLGLREIETRYTVFLDNDVMVTDGWLGRLVHCAEETGAAYVSPVICLGNRTPPVVHFAGGENRLVEEGGRRHIVVSYTHQGRPLPDVLGEIDRQPTAMAEFHAILVRTEALTALGGLDERCSTAFEHNDLGLSIAARGGTGWLEPAAVVFYLFDRATKPANAGYHLVRWSRAWIDESLDGFCTKWRLRPDDPGLAASLDSLHGRRRRPLRYLRGLAWRLAHQAGTDYVDRVADRWVDGVLCKRLDRGNPALTVSRWPGAHG